MIVTDFLSKHFDKIMDYGKRWKRVWRNCSWANTVE
jgi:hypothetical protein